MLVTFLPEAMEARKNLLWLTVLLSLDSTMGRGTAEDPICACSCFLHGTSQDTGSQTRSKPTCNLSMTPSSRPSMQTPQPVETPHIQTAAAGGKADGVCVFVPLFC